MWANTVWGFIALAVACVFTVFGLSADYAWLRPYLLNAAFTSAVASAFAFCWPLIKRGIVGGNARLHPARYSDKDTSLIDTIWWVAERSAWGRWQTAQRGKWQNEYSQLMSAASFVQVAARNGDLAIKGRLRDSIEYHPIGRDLWRRVYIDLRPDSSSLWKAVLKPHDESIAIPEYDHWLVELRAVESLWPRRDWRCDWQTFRLNLRSALNRMTDQKPKVEETQQAEIPTQQSEATAAMPEPPKTHSVVASTAIGVATSVTTKIEFAVTPLAPENWEQLFVIGDDGRSVWLKFLPDTKHYRADTLLLIVYGQKVLRDVPRVKVEAAHAAVEKTIQNAPNQPRVGGFLASVMMQQFTTAVNRDWVDEYVPSYLERVGLSQGGFYQLTDQGLSHAAALAYDLIRRA
jgi:hypothetical protein